jgi:hypothetical protein
MISLFGGAVRKSEFELLCRALLLCSILQGSGLVVYYCVLYYCVLQGSGLVANAGERGWSPETPRSVPPSSSLFRTLVVAIFARREAGNASGGRPSKADLGLLFSRLCSWTVWNQGYLLFLCGSSCLICQGSLCVSEA